MGDNKGILTKEQEKRLAQIVDDVLKLKGLWELIDGYAAKALITFVDDAGIEKLNLTEDFKLKLSALVDAAIDEDVDEASAIAAEILNDLVDVPGLDEDAEGVLFEGAVKFIVGAVIDWLRKKKK